MTTAAEALTVRCPTCKAWAGRPCTYAIVAEPVYHSWASSKVLERVALNGMPTKKPHLARFQAAFRKARRTAHKPVDKTEVSPAWRAVRQFDIEEHEAMRAWLRDHGEILWRVT